MDKNTSTVRDRVTKYIQQTTLPPKWREALPLLQMNDVIQSLQIPPHKLDESKTTIMDK
jgi:hypothetical protein